LAKKKTSNRKPASRQPDERGERLQKVLAAAGHGSRRACEELIVAGRVEVDREIVTELGTRVDPRTQEIRVDGVKLPRIQYQYFLVNKPPGVVSTNRDPAGRARVVDLVPGDQRLFTVGRLDKSSEGLLLVTNDGDLANRLAHPRYEVEKVYQVVVAGHPSPKVAADLKRGVHLAEGVARAKEVRFRKKLERNALLEIVLAEGRNREIRRMLARVGHKVLQLRRIAFGPLKLGELPPGDHRELTGREVSKLVDWAYQIPAKRKRGGKRPAPPKKTAKPKPSPGRGPRKKKAAKKKSGRPQASQGRSGARQKKQTKRPGKGKRK